MPVSLSIRIKCFGSHAQRVGGVGQYQGRKVGIHLPGPQKMLVPFGGKVLSGLVGFKLCISVLLYIDIFPLGIANANGLVGPLLHLGRRRSWSVDHRLYLQCLSRPQTFHRLLHRYFITLVITLRWVDVIGLDHLRQQPGSVG